MKHSRLTSILRLMAVALVLSTGVADAQPFGGGGRPGEGRPRMAAPMDARPFQRERPPRVAPGPAPGMVQGGGGNCFAVGQQIAAQNGGQLANASMSVRGGRQVCVIVVLVPGRGGERPRRAEFVVPL
jgi:hypothetical protein